MKRTDDGAVATDDSKTANSSVTTGSGTDPSRRRRWYGKLDRTVISPFRILWNDWRGSLGMAILATYLVMGTVGTHLVKEPSSDIENRLLPAFQSWEYPLGTDSSGMGLLAQTVHATPDMIEMILAGGVFAILVGAAVGMIAGYKGGTTDQVLMLVTDTLMTLPGLPLVIVLAFLFDPRSSVAIGILLAINAWTGLARAVRSQMLPLREIEYVEASRTMNAPYTTILWEDILPNLMPYISVNFVNASRQIIFASVALYFLGVLPTSDPNWGVMIDQAYSSGGALYSWDTVHWLLVPMIAVVMISLGLILVSQAADKLFNPRIRARHQKTTASDETIEH